MRMSQNKKNQLVITLQQAKHKNAAAKKSV